MKKLRQKKPIPYPIERVVLSDVLPYETPVIFSNRYFFRFLTKYGIKIDQKQITWRSSGRDEVIKTVLSILFDCENKENPIDPALLNDMESRKIPFEYKITHKEKKFRNLGIPHPKNQLELISFYDEFKELIIYYSKQSSFSIRKPESIAKYIYVKDDLFKRSKGDEDDSLEESGKEYKSLRTFFTYERYSNIYKFYEDYTYHRSEKKYRKMFKFDIARCFDSIYTHSLSWALLGKSSVKIELKKEPLTFSGRFDKIMQNANYGETNGILIGPEFSRIFAELILQCIDKQVEKNLLHEGKVHKVDYDIYRYVDDFFIFYNDNSTKDEILNNYEILLSNFKMSLNDSKSKDYSKPLITEITIAKNKILNLIEKEIIFKIRKDKDREDKEVLKVENLCQQLLNNKKIKVGDVKIRCNANKLITEFKTIIVVSEVEYKDVMNFTLAVIKSDLEKNIKKYEKYRNEVQKQISQFPITAEEENKLIKQEENFTTYILEMVDLVFFLYGVSPKVNSTIKLVKILSFLIRTLKKKIKFPLTGLNGQSYILQNRYNSINKDLIFKKISDEITLILDRSRLNEHLQIETLYLFIIIQELGKPYRLSFDQLEKYLNLKEIKDGTDSFSPKRFEFKNDINYFVITVLLFYFKNIKNYSRLKIVVKNAVIKRIKVVPKNMRKKHSELILLFFDLLSCPYLNESDKKFKKELLTLFGVPSEQKTEFLKFVESEKFWFIKWSNFRLMEELESKSSFEPY